MDVYVRNNLIIIPTQITYNEKDNKKYLEFPKKWSSIKTPGETTELFQKYKGFKCMAMLTGKVNNLTVIDVDNREAWDKLKIDYPSECVKVETNKGFHLYFDYEASLTTRSNIIDGIDVRNDGGNSILPPSSYKIKDEWIEYTFEGLSIDEAISKMKNLPKIPDSLLKLLNDSINKPSVIRVELPNCEKIRKIRKCLNNVSPKFYKNYGNIKNLAYALVNCSSKINLEIKNIYKEYCALGNVYEDEYNKLWETTEINNSIGLPFLNNIVRKYKLNNLETDIFDKDILIGLLSKKKDLAIDYMNRHFAIITSNNNGKILYCELEYKEGRISNIILIAAKENFMSKIPDSIQIEYMEDKYQSMNKYWLASSNRNEYRKTVFEPGLDCWGNLNMFLGFNHIYDKTFHIEEKKLTYIFKHLLEVICDNNKETFEYLLNWMAHILQFPTFRMGVAVVCKSIQGVGKNIFFENFFGSMIIGRNHGICISDTDQVVGKFNSVLEKMIFTVVNELKADGDIIKMSNLLKSLITDTTQKIEKKGIDAIHISNYNNFVFLSNNHNVVNVEMYDRRYLCLAASSKYANNQDYFNTLSKNMLDEEISKIFFHYLMNRDLSNFKFRDIPLTQYKKELIYNSIPAVMKWFNDYVKECINDRCDDHHIKLKVLCDKYKEKTMQTRLNVGTFQRQLIDTDRGVSCIKIKNYRNTLYVDFNVDEVKEEMIRKSIWYDF